MGLPGGEGRRGLLRAPRREVLRAGIAARVRLLLQPGAGEIQDGLVSHARGIQAQIRDQ